MNENFYYCQQRFGAIGVLGIPKRRDKVGFVLGSSVFNLCIWLTKSPTDAKPRDVNCHFTEPKMKTNFEVIENYAINFEGKHIDLHNNFDYFNFENNIEKREIKLHFRKSNGKWIPETEINSLILIHKNANFLRIIEQDENSKFEVDCSLSEISFFPSTEREMNDSIIPQSKPKEKDDILYFFENGQLIRIHCEEVLIEINQKMEVNELSDNLITEQEAFWVMFYFLKEHYELSGGEFDVSDIQSASQPFEFDENGHFDGKVNGNRKIKVADNGMIWHWNEAIKKYKENGIPKPELLKQKKRQLTAVCKIWGFGLNFTHCFVLLWSVINRS